MHDIHDVAVIGGGPAGSTAAALLAGGGRRVILFERERFPRFHIGESLLPFNMDLFRKLGVDGEIESRYTKKYGALMMSGDGSLRRRIDFADGLVPGYPMAYQVLRSSFDHILLRNAEAKGARVLEGSAVVGLSTSDGGWSVSVRHDDGGAEASYRARFLIDASGQDAFVAARRGMRRMMPRLRRSSAFAHYENVARQTGPEGGDIILIVLRDGWIWMIPLPGGVTSVGLVTDPRLLRSVADPLEKSLRCPAARERMAGARRISEVRTASDYSYECRQLAGDRFLLAGDAAGFIDPIFSSGVMLAMSSAELAADALEKTLSGSTSRRRAFRAYEKRVLGRIRTYLRIVERFYRPGFMDVFLNPTERFGLKGAVTSLLAGVVDPPLALRLRLRLFYAVLAIQRRVAICPIVPLTEGFGETGADAGGLS